MQLLKSFLPKSCNKILISDLERQQCEIFPRGNGGGVRRLEGVQVTVSD